MLAIGISTENDLLVWSDEAATFFGTLDIEATLTVLVTKSGGIHPERILILENGDLGVPQVVKDINVRDLQ